MINSNLRNHKCTLVISNANISNAKCFLDVYKRQQLSVLNLVLSRTVLSTLLRWMTIRLRTCRLMNLVSVILKWQMKSQDYLRRASCSRQLLLCWLRHTRQIREYFLCYSNLDWFDDCVKQYHNELYENHIVFLNLKLVSYKILLFFITFFQIGRAHV